MKETLHNHVLLQHTTTRQIYNVQIEVNETCSSNVWKLAYDFQIYALERDLDCKYCFFHCHTDYQCQHVVDTPFHLQLLHLLMVFVQNSVGLSTGRHVWAYLFFISERFCLPVNYKKAQGENLVMKHVCNSWVNSSNSSCKKQTWSFCISKRKWQVRQDGQSWYPVFRLSSLGSVIWTLCTPCILNYLHESLEFSKLFNVINSQTNQQVQKALRVDTHMDTIYLSVKSKISRVKRSSACSHNIETYRHVSVLPRGISSLKSRGHSKVP